MTRRSITAIIVTAGSILAVYLLFLFVTSMRQLDVAGQVIHAATNQPVSHARVVVIRGQWPSVQHVPKGYGTTTDENGVFRIQTGVRRGFGKIWVVASSPSNGFARVRYRGQPVVLRTADLDPKLQGREYMLYENFTGSSGVLAGGLKFIGEGWKVEPRH